MNTRTTRFVLRRLVAGSALATWLASASALAQDHDFDLPAQPMASALTSLAQQGQLQVLFDEAQLRDVRAPALKGRYSPRLALERLLSGTGLELVEAGDGFVVRRRVQQASADNALQLDAQTVVGNGTSVDSSSVGRSTLTRKEIERQQADNVPSLLQTLPGVTMGGSAKPGGQTVNIWGLGDAEDVPFTLDGASKSGFERYQQGTVFIEPELIKRIEVEKGPYSVFTGNGGFGGTVHMETKDAPDLLEDGRDVGAMLKYGYHSNDQQKIYSGAVYGRTEDGRADGLAYLTTRDGRDMKLADHIQIEPGYEYPERYPHTDQKLDGVLLKGNFRPNEEHGFGLTYMRSVTEQFGPFSAASFYLPSKYSVDLYGGLENAMRRNLADREVVDTTWAGKYTYQPLDNPWIDLELKASYSETEQTDERRAGANYSLTSGGKWIRTDYQDKVVELRNISRFSTAALEHELTTGLAWHHHNRDVLMYLPGSTYNVARYNYGWFQPYFMPRGEQTTRSAYVQDAITLGDVTITPSMRFDAVRNQGKENLASVYNNAALGHDYSAQEYSGWSPRLSVFWRVNDNVGLFADYAKTWRAPVIDEQYELQNSTTIGGTSRGLDPERIRGVRVGSVLSFGDLIAANDALQVRTTLFHHKIEDEIFKLRSIACERQAIEGGSISAKCAALLPLPNYRNLDGVTLKGAEFEAYYDSSRMFGSLSYSWVSGKHQGAYSNPWGPDVWARDVPAPKWVAMVGVKIPEIATQVGWQGEFVRKTDRVPGDLYNVSGETVWDNFENDSYDVHRLFAEWAPQSGDLKGTKVNFTVDNVFNRFYRANLSGDAAYSQGRNAKISITRFF
ncbi:TonB-dependent receptor [Metapseudomonas otitidis]|uniref:TonB-dependent receptor n=1 Tax=Metapseudomonas otitidis TaxID=319939 RepID=UPI0008EC17C7|nr:hemoglobin/transferrin/lactoferrin receptor protein [Pseudomonas otitidis]